MRQLLTLLCLSACAEFPSLEDTITQADRDAPYPTLSSIEPVLTQAQSATAASTQIEADLRSRVAALQARAARLRALDI